MLEVAGGESQRRNDCEVGGQIGERCQQGALEAVGGDRALEVAHCEGGLVLQRRSGGLG